jgi:hypothetical protein
LGVLLVARESRCAGLTPLLSGWDGTLNPLLRKRLHRHIDGCATCGSIRSTRLDPSALLASFASLPFLAVPTVLFGQSSPSAVPFLRDLPSPASPSPGGTPTPGGGPTGGTSPSTPGTPGFAGGTSPSHGGPPGGASPSHGGAPGSEAGTSPSHGGAPGSEGGAPGSLGGTSPSTHGGTPPAAPGDAGDKFAPGSHRSTPSGQGRSPSTPAIRWGKDGFPVQPAVGGSSRKAVIAVAAGVAAAIVIAVCGTAILHNGRSGTPDTVVTLDAVVLSQSPAPDGTSPAASPPKSTGTPALAFTATGSAICIGGLDYKVTVNVTANAVLATATFYRPGATPMTVAGKTATVTVSVFGGSSLAWHVRVVAADGRALTGPNRTTANPCP